MQRHSKRLPKGKRGGRGGGGALTSPTHTPHGAKFTTAQACGLGLQQCQDIGGPAEAINKEKEKGRCFAFDGRHGSLTVKLADIQKRTIERVCERHSCEHAQRVLNVSQLGARRMEALRNRRLHARLSRRHRRYYSHHHRYDCCPRCDVL